MRLAGNVGRAVSKASNSWGGAREANRVVKFGLLCDGGGKSFHKVER